MKSEVAKALDRTHELLRQSYRVLKEHSETVERSRRLINQSLKLIARAKPDR
jgi:hypothetical protein